MTIKWIKWNKCEIYKNSCIWVHRMDVRQQPFSSRQKAEIHKQILNKKWRRWQAMAPHPIPLPRTLAFSPPYHRGTTTPSPCWAPHFMTQRIMSSNPTPASRASLPPRRWAMTRHRLSLRPCTAPPSCSLQPFLKLSLLSFRPSLLQSVSIVSPLLNHGNPIFVTCVCVFTLSSSAFTYLIEMNFSFKSLFAIWSLSPQQFHYYFSLV